MVTTPVTTPGSSTEPVHHFGWIPDKPDQRDHYFAVPHATMVAPPASVDLRSQCPPIYDQGQLGSCTANGIAAAIHFDRMKQKLTPDFIPSRLFIYYNERVMENTVNSDAGAAIRDGIKSVAQQGDCPENEWSYDISQFARKPPAKCYLDARKYKTVQYQAVMQILSQMKGCLASGYPFVFGFTVYESFESQQVAQTGMVPMPGQTEKVLGGHCMLVVGYDDAQQRFLVRNSWGTGWALQGYCTMPYAYLADANLSSDFWTVRLVSH